MAASSSPLSTRTLPWRRLRSYVLEIRTECVRMLREPMFVLPVLLFPALFYVLFGVLLNRGNPAAATYLLASYGVFGVIGAAMFGLGVGIAVDRQRGLLRLKRVLPVPAGAPLLAKMVMAMAFAAGVSILVGLLARFAAGVQLAPSQWGLLLVVDVLGALPFCAIGLYFGTLVSGSAAPALLNLVYLPMAFLSGLWLPLSMLPDVLGRIAPVWPAYHLAQLALKAVGHDQGTPAWQHVLMLSGCAVVFFLLAQRRLSRAE
jgi:ABC-2 type transport system permease protein